LFDYSTSGPNSLAARIIHARDPEERKALCQQLLAETASMMTARDGDRRLLAQRLREGRATLAEETLAAELLLEGKKRAAHRPTTLDRELREDMAKSYLRTWRWLEPHQRISQGAVIRLAGQNYRISRAEAFELLKQIKAETVEHAEVGDAVGEPATAVRAAAGLLIRRGQDRQRSRRLRKASKARATESG
jgi:hypothetical protein